MTTPQNPFENFDKDGLPIKQPPSNPFAAPMNQQAQPVNQPFQAPQQAPMFQQSPQPLPPQMMQAPQYPMTQAAPKQMIVAALLAFFLGTFGVHNFYLGYTKKAAWQLGLTMAGYILSLVVVGIFLIIGVGIWVLVDFIMILMGSSPYDRDNNGVPLQR